MLYAFIVMGLVHLAIFTAFLWVLILLQRN